MRINVANRLSEGESVIYEACTTKTGLVAAWISVPGFLAVTWFITYFPIWLRALVSDAFKDTIFSELGIVELGDFSVTDYILQSILGDGFLMSFVKGLLTVSSIMLIAAWLAVSLIMTKKHKNNGMTITDRRVFCHSESKNFEVSFEDISQIYVEHSLGGRIFKYGNILVQSRKGAITVKNLENPEKIHKLINERLT